MRIAFFGGSFDPPHLGHLRIAEAAAERLRLDRILVAPVALQPLKRELNAPPSATYADRLAMLRLFIADQQQALIAAPQPVRVNLDLILSELDSPRADNQPNYTYDTLLQLRALLASSTQQNELFVLIGADSFLSMHRWYRAADLLLLANWIVAGRPGFSLRELDQALPATIRPSRPSVEGHRYIEQQLASPAGQTVTLYLLPDLQEDVSATEIRSALAQDAGSSESTQSVAASSPGSSVLSPSVAAYIRTHGLYR